MDPAPALAPALRATPPTMAAAAIDEMTIFPILTMNHTLLGNPKLQPPGCYAPALPSWRARAELGAVPRRRPRPRRCQLDQLPSMAQWRRRAPAVESWPYGAFLLSRTSRSLRANSSGLPA